MLTLFYAPRTCALATHIALEEAGAKFEARRVNFAANEQRSLDYLKLNPKGRVPALVTDKGVLTETPALLIYVAQTHPAAKLIPEGDAFALAQIQSFNSYICSTVHVNHAHKVRGARWADDTDVIEAMKKKVPETMGASMALVEEGMLKGPWVMGDAFTIADPYLYVISTWLAGDGVDINRFPKIAAHLKRMEARPAVQRVLAREAA